MSESVLQQDLLQAFQTLKKQKWVDLTHTFSETSPHFHAFSPAKIETLFTHDEGFFAQQFSFAGQYGTHLDAPIHFVRDTRFVEDLDLQELALPLIVIDITSQVQQNPGHTVTIEDILSFENEHGIIEAGSFVALRTDWSKRWPDVEAFNNVDEAGVAHVPGWSVEVLSFLFKERNIKSIGHETFDTDSSEEYRKHGSLAAEYFVLEQDTYQVELLTNLDQLPAKGAVIFNIVAKPEKASGFPVRSFAIAPN